MKLFSYVVEHDKGHAPNPYFGICTLCRCKYRKSPNGHRNVVELAQKGDWIVGTGGARLDRSAGHGKIVYAMQVEDIITRKQYYASPRFKSKKPRPSGTYEQQRGDNKPPKNSFERQEQFVLISRHRFYYFGRNAIPIPHKKFPGLEKRGPGFKQEDFDNAYVMRFVNWITRHKRGIRGEPWMKQESEGRRTQLCKSSY